MKIRIENLHITIPPEPIENSGDPNPIRVDKQRETIAELRKCNENQKTTIEQMRKERERKDFAADTISHGEHYRILGVWRDRNKVLRGEKQKLAEQLDRKTQALHIETGDNVELRHLIKRLEDKIAGYELGMSKEQVDKECGQLSRIPPKYNPDTHTMKGEKRKNAKRLTIHEVWQIRRYIEAGRSITWIANTTGLTTSTVGKLKRGEAHALVRPEPENAPKCLTTRWQHAPVAARAGHGVIKQGKKK